MKLLATLAAVLLAGCVTRTEMQDDIAPAVTVPCPGVDAVAAPAADSGADAGAAVDAAPEPTADAGDCADEPFTLDAAAPAQVSTAGGELVTLTGSGFCQLTDLEVNAESVTFALVDDAHLVFTMPDETERGPGSVQVVAYGAGSMSATIELTAVSP